MENIDKGSLSGLPFFEGLSKQDILNLINNSKHINEESIDGGLFYRCFLDNFKFYDEEDYRRVIEEEFYKALSIELVIYSIETKLHTFLFDEEEVSKIEYLVEKKQYNSKLLKSLINKLVSLTSYNKNRISITLAKILERDLNKRYKDILNEKVKKEFKPLKDIIDKITSGISSKCYLELERTFPGINTIVPNEVNDYIVSKYNYDLKKIYFPNFISDTLKATQRILEKTLVDNDDFWDKKDINGFFNRFFTLILKYNDIKHAQKIVDYMFDKLLKNETYKYMIDNNYNLGLQTIAVQEGLINRCINFTFGRFEGAIDFSLTEEERDNLLYPLRDHNALDGIDKGKVYFEEFIKDAYKDDYKKVLEIFSDTNTIIQESTHVRKRRLSLGIMLEASMFGYHSEGELGKGYNQEKDFYYDYYKFNDTILDRFYYRVYLIHKYSKKHFKAALYEVLYDCLSIINDEFNLYCSYVYNTEVRDDKYNELKEILKDFGLNLSDSYKEEYVVALLDRKVATMKEIGMFSELEEIGDAIYELAVNNILFYQDDESCIKGDTVKLFIESKKQKDISKKLGFDKLYISSFNSLNFNNKFDSDDYVHFSEDGTYLDDILLAKHNYIADSLEMIIGAVYKEFGVQRAMDFATDLIIKTHEEYHKPVIKEYNEEDAIMSKCDWVFNKYYPSYTDKHDYYFYGLNNMEYALEKVLKVILVGNETIEKRHQNRYLSLSDLLKGLPDASYRATCYYLRYGIEKTIKFYKTKIN